MPDQEDGLRQLAKGVAVLARAFADTLAQSDRNFAKRLSEELSRSFDQVEDDPLLGEHGRNLLLLTLEHLAPKA